MNKVLKKFYLRNFFFHPFLLFTLIGFLLYLPTLNAPFIYDDYDLILGNPLVHDFSFLFQEWQQAPTHIRILTNLTFAINYALSHDSPMLYHLMNTILHIANSCLLYLLLRIILTTPQIIHRFTEQQKNSIAFWAALFFVIHPIQTSAVNYIWQRAELLNALFYFLTLIFYLRARMGNPWLFVAALGCFAVGFFAKGTIVSLPLVIILLEFSLWAVSRKFIGFLIVFLFILQANLYLDQWAAVNQRWGAWIFKTTGTIATPEFFCTQIEVMVRYLGLAFFPFRQNFDYDVGLITSFTDPRVLRSLIILAIVLLATVLAWRRYRLVAMGMIWFFLCLLPAVFLGGREPMWEYRMYLSLAGITLAITAFIFQVQWPPWIKKPQFILVLVASLWSGLAVARNFIWQSPERLYLDNIAKSPQRANPYHLLGTWYLFQGRETEAVPFLEKTIILAPDAPEPYNNLGLILKNQGDFLRAKKLFEKAIELRPNFTAAYVNLAYLVLNRGEDERAEELLQKSLGFAQTEGAYAALGKVHISRGRFQEAEIFLNKATVINPRAYQAYFWLGEMHALQGKPEKAKAMYQKAVSINPRVQNKVPKQFQSN